VRLLVYGKKSQDKGGNMKAVIQRLREPSSMAGLAALVAAFFPSWAPVAAPFLTGLFGVLAVVLPEGY
jgi:hypothetical protein